MHGKIRALAILSSAAALLAWSPSGASAMTMNLGTPALTAKVLVTVPVTVSCSPFDPSLTPFSAGASISIEQAIGKEIARGSGSLTSFAPSPLFFACDATEHTIAVDVLADVAGPPFRRGDAVFRGSAFASAAQQCGPTCFFNFTSQTASVGPMAMKIH